MTQVSQRREVSQLYLTFSWSGHHPRGVWVSRGAQWQKTGNNGWKITSRQRHQVQPDILAGISLSDLWGNPSLPTDHTTAGGGLASLRRPYEASQWTCPPARSDPRGAVWTWGGGGTQLSAWGGLDGCRHAPLVGFFVTFLYAPPCAWGARLLTHARMWVCSGVCVCVCVWMCKEDVEADPERLTHRPVVYPITAAASWEHNAFPHMADLLTTVSNTHIKPPLMKCIAVSCGS